MAWNNKSNYLLYHLIQISIHKYSFIGKLNKNALFISGSKISILNKKVLMAIEHWWYINDLM